MATMEAAAGEGTLYGADNTSSILEGPKPTEMGLLQNPKIAIGFCFLMVFILGKVFGGKKLPAGVKPLPRLPGTSQNILRCVRIWLTHACQVFHMPVGSGMCPR